MTDTAEASQVAAVVIGRNEGARLIRCLASLAPDKRRVVYVDSGSTDGSVEAARSVGAQVIELDMSIPFTAARARNAGIASLQNTEVNDYVQVIDGDCELQAGWIDNAVSFMDKHKDVAMVAGRLRERFPEATLWNRMADAEWDTPIGETKAVGGIAMLRRTAVQQVGGYREDLIAGEEPELGLRLRRAGWRLWRLDAEMALHDIAMTRFGQWWRRTARNGFAIAQGAHLHGRAEEKYRVAETRRALVWGAVVPLVALFGSLWSPWAFVVLMLWPLQVVRLRSRGMDWTGAFFLTLGKVAEAQGVMRYAWQYATGQQKRLIEYK